MNPNYLPLTSIYIPPEDEKRIREPENTKKAVASRITSLLRFGQLQPILVEKLEDPIDDRGWRLIDGQVRFLSIASLSYLHSIDDPAAIEMFETHPMKPGFIEATHRDTLTPLNSLMMEFHANEDRDDFTWEEKAAYIRRIHDMLQEEHGRKNWSNKKTAEAIGQSEATLSHYLQLTDEKDPATQSAKVKKATTKGAALKQLKIEKARTARTKKAAKAKLTPTEGRNDFEKAAELSVFRGDCREWIKNIPDGSLDWFHWDPPYGGQEGTGGAFAAHDGIQTSHDYALDLMLQMFNEIHRVLVDGAWIVLWYTPVHYNWIRLALQGHRFSQETGECHYCSKHILRDYVWLSTNYSCVKSQYRFWVNPYPNLWRKERAADGHEITRFLTKETEPFLLAGKQGRSAPILLRSDRGNIFSYRSVSGDERRHVNHKPPELLSEILTLISVPGSLGADAGSGSGSIIEAAHASKRRIIVAEMDEDHHSDSLAQMRKGLDAKNAGPSNIVSWLEAKFTR